MSTTAAAILLQLAKLGITCTETLGLGNVVPTVFRASRMGESLVVKIGLSPRAAEEVRMNWEAYGEMEAIGAHALLPEPIEMHQIMAIPVLIMGDCDPNFWHASKSVQNPIRLYENLIKHTACI